MTKTPPLPHEGTIVSMLGDKLTTTCSRGQEHCHTLAKGASVTRDGKGCKSSDLKVGANVVVTTQTDEGRIATRIESTKAVRAASKA
jgi:hypothetical protein